MKIYDLLKNTLLTKKEFRTQEGELNYPQIQEQGYNATSLMINTLMSNDAVREKFFIKKDDILIYNRDLFMEYIGNKNFLANSYTKYSNKIGLAVENKFFKQNSEVVLNFPFKDCVLEGGQTKDNKKQNELFFNEILAQDEIDRLLDLKVLTNAKRINKDGESQLTGFTKDEKGNIKDNLLIKGNNLIALHTLKQKFKGKIKLIYIDPPYNTGNDSFNYNDNFNHSTWLTFMKNRLEIARELLRDDGVIFVQCDDNEQAYLKVLMDEIFGRENFVSTSCIVVNRGGRDYGGIAKTHEYFNIFSKMYHEDSIHMIEDKGKKFNFYDDIGGFDLMELRNRNILFNDKNRPNLYYPFYINLDNKDKNDLYEISLDKKENWVELYPLKSQGVQTVWRWGKEKSKENLNIEINAKRKSDGGFMIVQKNRLTSKRQRSLWDEVSFVNEKGSEHIKLLFGEKKFLYPKSEALIQRIIEISTQEGDIVLDYHMGSGTTGAVAHKMGRQWIGIEQMELIEDITKERIKKVIEGEQGGISKAVEWQGGGEFVYMELKENTAEIINKITNSQTKEELLDLKNGIKEYTFIDYKVDLEFLKRNDADFNALSLEDQKKILISIFDKNQLYINYSEMDDSMFSVSEEEKRISRELYNGKG